MDAYSIYNLMRDLCKQGNVEQLVAMMNTIENWEQFRTDVNTKLGKNIFLSFSTPLQSAAEEGRLECVKAFERVADTADWNAVFETAFELNHTAILNYVLPKAAPQFLEDWSCAFASKGNLRAIEATLPYLSDQGKQMVLYYAASAQHDSVVDYLSEHTNATEVFQWMLVQENITTAQHEQWINHKLNQLQNTRLTQTIQSVATPRVSRKI